MSDLNVSSSPAPVASGATSSELAELKELCADLRWQTHTLRIALLIVASALSAFFWLEVRRNGHTLTLLRPQAAQIVEANKVQDPVANRFLGQLVEFAKTHPDFAAILKKYPIQGPAATVTGSAPAAATSAIPTAPKK
jgi:hypothetical protein